MKKGKVKFFKRINVQIIASIVILSIIYLVSSVCSSYAQEQALGGMTRIYNKWIKMDRIESQLQHNVSDNQVSLEMMGYSHEFERIQELQNSIYSNIDSDAELLDALNELEASMEANDFVGADRETVETLISDQNAAVIKLDKLLKETIVLHASGDAEAAQVKYEEMKAVSVEVQEYQAEILKLIEEEIDAFVEVREDVANKYSKVSDILFFVFIAVDIMVILVVNRNVMKPIKVSSAKLNKIVDDIKSEQGNLNERLEIKRDNEVGHMVDGVNMFIEQLQQIMVKIKEESVNMNQIASSINEKITESNEDITTFSATMEELSASMEEVSATLEQLATNGQYILNESNGMYTKAAQGKDFVLDVKNKAVDIRNEATESKNQTLELISSIRENLATAIEKSASVRKIDELTNEILSISSQTNLLALNASIEAARAGEQGKGFAVVADQIRELAENSKTTATNIQLISKMVIDSVDALSSNANDMITFIDGTVLVDYDKFVDTANAYYSDTDYMGNILQDFYESSNKLVDTMQIISDSLDGINIAVEESAEGVTSAASNTTNLVESMTHIMEEVTTNERIAKELSLEVKKFNEV